MNSERDNWPLLQIIKHDDVDAVTRLAEHVGAEPNLWDDRVRTPEKAGPWFASIFANPANIVFDICDGGGVVAFAKMIPNWRAMTFAALWTREAVRAEREHRLFRSAIAAAMDARSLLVVDSFVRDDNVLGQKCALRAGSIFRGRIAEGTCYNGRIHDVFWYEVDREAVGLGGQNGESIRRRTKRGTPDSPRIRIPGPVA